GDSSSYKRELDLDKALHTVRFQNKGITFTRTAFASFPDQVIVLHEQADKKGALSFEAGLNSQLRFTTERISENHLVLKGRCPSHVDPVYQWRIKDPEAIRYDESGEGMRFEVHLLIKNSGGKISCDGQSITVSAADDAVILISAATSYNGFDRSPGREGKDPSVAANRFLRLAAEKNYATLLQRHIADYQPIFRRMQINLGKSPYTALPTDERLRHMRDTTDPELVALIAQFGRYVLIAGSRPGGQPVNLKGIWNRRIRPEYSSNWCIDHDAQMFYYAVETTNLSEMHEPFLRFISGLARNGAKTASVNYGMRGWCAHHNTDIWRQTGPVGNWGEGNPHWATWNMSGPWLCAHLYEHYQFNGDKKFLVKEAWPLMKGAARFCLDWLIADKNGKLISVPSVSPENTFITEKGDTAQISVNSTADIALMKELFTNCLRVADQLQIKDAFVGEVRHALSRLKPYRIGSKGQLLEWAEEWRPVDPSHRHLSHMYPVFPGSEISTTGTPALAKAAKVALTLRQKTNCSWGFAWKAACWARLAEPDSAWATWKDQLQYVDPKSTSSVNNYGLYPNLFNSDGKDLIMNGNGCATAVLAEMLMQSHTDTICLLPALPKNFPSGSVNGICARGGFVIDFSWKNAHVQNLKIMSKLGNRCLVRILGDKRSTARLLNFPTKRSGSYIFSFANAKN
ncbi:MAG: glycoside hydrolase N-terminal domain-containing protein, partial [Mucilaginibacter polytrichastri]|nr:glycoside hydrolase N-terminal domain-containing protein [Mucilaginibacter polytrichastri]